jgi:cytochrome c-type biogenesis protein CcmH/NrfG
MKPETIETIEQYINDEMSPTEREDFELRLAADEELRTDLELYNSINTTMSASPNEDELRKTLQQMNKKYFVGETAIKKGSFKKWLAVAASLVFIIAVSFYFLLANKPSAEKLYAQYAQHETLNIQLRGNAADSLKEKAAAAFNNKNYGVALPLAETWLQQNPGDVQMQFSVGICYLETGNYIQAEKIFLLLNAGQSAYSDAAQWYLGLTALKQNDLVKCRSRLNSIPSSSAYFTKAKQLLEKLPD